MNDDIMLFSGPANPKTAPDSAEQKSDTFNSLTSTSDPSCVPSSSPSLGVAAYDMEQLARVVDGPDRWAESVHKFGLSSSSLPLAVSMACGSEMISLRQKIASIVGQRMSVCDNLNAPMYDPRVIGGFLSRLASTGISKSAFGDIAGAADQSALLNALGSIASVFGVSQLRLINMAAQSVGLVKHFKKLDKAALRARVCRAYSPAHRENAFITERAVLMTYLLTTVFGNTLSVFILSGSQSSVSDGVDRGIFDQQQFADNIIGLCGLGDKFSFSDLKDLFSNINLSEI